MNGTKEDLLITKPYGSQVPAPAAPKLEGKKFLYWQGSRYYPGDMITVTENHTLTAIWGESDPVKPTDSKQSSNKNDNVVTCQMAGYPANYTWNESAKACQPGYIDDTGVFHGTPSPARNRVVNTYDRGLNGSILSLISSTVMAIIAGYILRNY